MDSKETAFPISSDYLLNALSNVTNVSKKNLRCFPLKGDASDRSFYRLSYESYEKEVSSVILMQFKNPPITQDIPFVKILTYLKECSVRVPELYFIDKDKGFIFLEDLGDMTLEGKLKTAAPVEQEKYYKKAIDILLHIQIECTERLNEDIPAYHLAFNVEKLNWELDFMVTHFIEGLLKHTLSKNDKKNLNEDFLKICSSLSKQKRYFCHRDYHSRNIMLNDDKLTVIDFQDAMMGPCQYDLASLLRDSYFKLSPNLFNTLLNYYINEKEKKEQVAVNKKEFLKIFDWMSIQRNLKALGTFGYQIKIRRNERFREGIPVTMEYIYRNLSKYNELHRLKKCLEMVYDDHSLH